MVVVEKRKVVEGGPPLLGLGPIAETKQDVTESFLKLADDEQLKGAAGSDEGLEALTNVLSNILRSGNNQFLEESMFSSNSGLQAATKSLKGQPQLPTI